MSAFLCSNTHTAVIAMLAHAPGIVSGEQIRETARILRALNDASLHQRYGDSPNPMESADFEWCIPSAVLWMRQASNADMLRAVQCFAYQCDCAPSDYPGRLILADIETRVSALPDADAPSGIWDI